jgi:hypothetical protein
MYAGLVSAARQRNGRSNYRAVVRDVKPVIPDPQLLAIAVVRRCGPIDDFHAPAARGVVAVGHTAILPQFRRLYGRTPAG